MSDLLVHWAVFDDCRRLLAHDERAEPFLNEVSNQQTEMARLGALSRGGKRFVPHILKALRGQELNQELNERDKQKLAYALGGILHFPTDFVFKPMMSQISGVEWNRKHFKESGEEARQKENAKREVSAYYDCHVFKKVYLEGREAPFSQFLLRENDTDAGRSLEEFVKALFQRALLSSHTLAPDHDHFDEWLDNLIDRVQPLYIDIALYVQVFNQPDPAKIEQFQVETTFYRDADPLIQLARRVQNGDSPSQDEFEAALNSDENTSGYSRALKIGIEAMREAGEFWRGEIPEPPDVSQG